MTVAVLGRQPQLALAELESLFGADAVQPLGKEAALLELPHDEITHARLGGTIKTAKFLTSVHSAQWRDIANFCLEYFPAHLEHLPEGKITLGLSAYGVRTNVPNINKTALALKKAIKKTGRAIRIVPNAETSLNSAQVLHNNLASTLGIELIFVTHGKRTYIGQTMSVQDIESYSRRDFDRPKRDAVVGMLPPKLAQIMLNLAQPKPHATILDPFCGTGVVLMEAALQGFAIEGSDLSQKMIDYTRANLSWLAETYHIEPQIKELCRADATTHQWRKAIDAVVCETYLGKPLTVLPDQPSLQKIIDECDQTVRKFLTNLHDQLGKNARCCIAVPAWQVSGRFKHLPVVDDLEKIGYNRISFSYATDDQLIYHRPGQIVARELLVLTR